MKLLSVIIILISLLSCKTKQKYNFEIVTDKLSIKDIEEKKELKFEKKEEEISFKRTITSDPYIQKLIDELKKPNSDREVMNKLFSYNKKEGIEALIAALKVNHPNVRTQAAKILIYSNDNSEKVRENLISFLMTEKDPDVLANVLQFIWKYKDNKIAEIINNLLINHQSHMVRAYSAYALGNLKYSKAKEDLIKSLNDSSSWVKLMALGALRKLNAKEASPYIVELLKDENTMVRERALQTLIKLTGKNFGKDYELWKKNLKK